MHIFVKTSLYPNGLDDISQALCTTLEEKYTNIEPSNVKYYNGFYPSGLNIGTGGGTYLYLSSKVSVGDTFTNNNGLTYRHIILDHKTGDFTFRVKIDY